MTLGFICVCPLMEVMYEKEDAEEEILIEPDEEDVVTRVSPMQKFVLLM